MQMVPGLSLKAGLSDFSSAGLAFLDRRGICSYSVNDVLYLNFYMYVHQMITEKYHTHL